jgi:hypothetical protein
VGSASAGATTGFTVRASAARAGKLGLVIYTNTGPRVPAQPFLGGLLCINGPVRRATTVASVGGTPGNCDAVFQIDMNAFAAGMAGGNPQAYLSFPGTHIDCQWWGRDTFASGSYLSDALGYCIGP